MNVYRIKTTSDMKNIIYLLLLAVGMSACTNDDYLIDGGTANPNVDMTTYDFLRSKPLFDTLVMAIDIAGLKDKVNEAKTFYVPTNFSFNKYITAELELRKKLDADAVYTFDSIPRAEFDSLQMYMFGEYLTRDSLVKEGEIYTSFIGKEFKLSKEPQDAYQNDLVIQPEYLYFINKVGRQFDSYEDTVDGNVASSEKDERIIVQTSGIITTTGVVHVLNNNHTLFFHVAKLQN